MANFLICHLGNFTVFGLQRVVLWVYSGGWFDRFPKCIARVFYDEGFDIQIKNKEVNCRILGKILKQFIKYT